MSDSRFKAGDPRINYAGGPTKEAEVKKWYKEHPGGSVSACARELDISRPTARKWMPEQMKLQKLADEQKHLQAKQPPSKLKRIWNIIKE